uniref:RNA-directed DNA polymerase, eukaryota, reverse transcriptase zinc-binding domain protein n=1 Tax=Tanacetum cinerariifolium TaxID=118510 RepID=A0A6L2NG02_TANCI|nr:RNA-directed DNA polymerase, eukaryota, reverse transcriptase zinc-binding domain protein [Tanacetum cinerariifolium]
MPSVRLEPQPLVEALHVTFLKAKAKVSSEVLNYLEKLRRNFFWGGSLDNKKLAWVAWKQVCSSKDCGGLGIGFKPTDVTGTWACSLNSLNTFTVSSMRYAIDSSTLVSTVDNVKWNKTLLIKINIHAWRLCKDRLPTRSNLNARVIDLDSLHCLIGGGWFAPQMILIAFFLGTNQLISTQRKKLASMLLLTPPRGSFGAFEIEFALT